MALSEQVYTVADPTSSLAQSLDDLQSVRTLLTDLPLQLRHEVLVPISPVGFLIGRIKHSNEVSTRQVLVHLGAEWYVKRTCAQAAEIIERRIEAAQPKEMQLEQAGERAKTKEEALAQLELLAEEEEKAEAISANLTRNTPEPVREIRERVPDITPHTQSVAQQPKKMSKFMRDRHSET